MALIWKLHEFFQVLRLLGTQLVSTVQPLRQVFIAMTMASLTSLEHRSSRILSHHLPILIPSLFALCMPVPKEGGLNLGSIHFQRLSERNCLCGSGGMMSGIRSWGHTMA